jgi:3-hydroxyacyl-[acyl-carrier-protein] dehydratase
MPETVIDIKGIMALIPHRFPMLLVDRVTIIEEGKKAVGLKNVTMNEDMFNGHFPNNPIMPGVLIIEAMAQTGAVMMLRLPELKGKTPFFAAIDNVKFRNPVLPGDQMEMHVECLRFGGRIAKLKGQAFVNKEMRTECEMTCVIADTAK